MLRWTLFTLAVALAALGALTSVKSPDWLPWRLGVVAGEYGHWFGGGALLLAGLAWFVRGGHPGLAAITAVMAAAAAVMLFKPALEARAIAAGLPAKLAAAFGPATVDRPPFSTADLILGRRPVPVTPQTLAVAAELPLDFYRPAPRRDGRPAPCVVVVHGGGWNGGDRSEIAHFNHWLAGQGYAVAALSYRLAPAQQWPAQRADVLEALAYLKNHAGELGVDPGRFVLLGRSAGGQIAQTVGYTAGDPAIRGVIALYAPSDLIFGYVNTHEDDMLKSPTLMRQFLGGTPDSARANYESASALFHVSRASPPTLLLHGTLDAVVWYRHSVRLDARLAEAGVPHAYVAMPWATHAFEFNLHGPGGQLTTYAVEWFLARVTQ
jgi:acetyl esterase/lipase